MVLHLAGARVAPVKSSLREDLLSWLVNPNIALLLLVCGALLIYLEFNTPGTIVPGALGTLMVLLAIFGLNLLPIRFTAVVLLLAAWACWCSRRSSAGMARWRWRALRAWRLAC